MEFEKMQEVIAGVLNVDRTEVKMDTTFVEDLCADSLDIFQIMMGVEGAYDIQIPKEEVEGIVSVRDAVDVIKRVMERV
jgi:acyl carrier protein